MGRHESFDSATPIAEEMLASTMLGSGMREGASVEPTGLTPETSATELKLDLDALAAHALDDSGLTSAVSALMRAAIENHRDVVAETEAAPCPDDETFNRQADMQIDAEHAVALAQCQSFADLRAKLTYLSPIMARVALSNEHADYVEAMQADIDRLCRQRAPDSTNDPIFAVIEENRRLMAVWNATFSFPDQHPKREAAQTAFNAHTSDVLLKTVPKTAQGCQALARYASEQFDNDAGFIIDEDASNHENWRILDLIARSPLLSSAGTEPEVRLQAEFPTAATSGLTDLVAEYEAAYSVLNAKGDLIWSSDTPVQWQEFQELARACGQLRARIAFHPVADLSDVMLKIRSLQWTNTWSEWQDLRASVQTAKGHAYDTDVTHAVVLDLIDLTASHSDARSTSPARRELLDQVEIVSRHGVAVQATALIAEIEREWPVMAAVDVLGDDSPAAAAAFEAAWARRKSLIASAEALPCDCREARHAKALALAWLAWAQREEAEEAGGIDSRLVLHIDASLTGTPVANEAVAEPCTLPTLKRYVAWLGQEFGQAHDALLQMLPPEERYYNPEMGRLGLEPPIEPCARMVFARWPDDPLARAHVSSAPPSTRAALVLSTVGLDWQEGGPKEARSTRSAALGAIAAAPPVSVPAVAASEAATNHETASPELLRLIVEHDRVNAILNIKDEEGNMSPTHGEMRAAADARFRVQTFPSRGLRDILAKAACLARAWSPEERERNLEHEMEQQQNWAGFDNMTEALAIEVMKLAEGKLCAAR